MRMYPESPKPGTPAPPTRVRYLMLLALAFAPTSAYLTRIISVANTTIAAEFDVSDEVMGQVIAGFALGYFFFQVPGGVLASTWGVRATLPLIGIIWSLCAVWSSLAGTPTQLQYSRIAIGLAQAGLVPCCTMALANWFPIERRGTASAIMVASMQVGAVLATGLTAKLLGPLGWRAVLQVYSIVGIVWAVVFYVWFRDHPDEHRWTNQAERDLIGRDRTGVPAHETPTTPAPTPSEPAPTANPSRIGPKLALAISLFTSVSLWAFYIQALFRAYGYEFFTTWCPAYLEKGYGLDREQAGLWSSVPVAAVGVGSVLAGFVVDAVLARTASRWISRSGSAIVGLGLCAACFAAAVFITDPRALIVVLSLGAFFSSLGGPATWAAAMDLGGKHSAVVAGMMNMMGNIGAYFCPLHLGKLFTYIEQTGASWRLVLLLLVGIYLAGAVCWIFVNPRRPAVE